MFGRLKNNRYLGLVISLSVLLGILSVGFAVNYQWSQKNAQILDGANYVGDMSDAMLHIAARANHLVILKDDDVEKRRKILTEIRKYHIQAEENLNNMLNDENMSAVPALKDKMLLMADVWRIYNEKILRLKLEERQYERDLADFVYTRLEPNHEVILQLYYDYFDESYNLIRRMNYLQIGLVVFSLIYFIYLIATYLKRFLRHDEALNAVETEMREIMATVDSGLFLLEKNLSIGQLQSQRLSALMGQEKLEGESLIKILRGMTDNQNLIYSTQEFVEQLYNPRVKEKLMESLNPLSEFKWEMVGQRPRYLRFDFRRVYREQEIVKVLVNVKDISSEILLAQQQKEEKHQSDMYLTMLRTMQTTDLQILREFIERVNHSCATMNQILREQTESSEQLRAKLDPLWRLIHGIKGEASALRLTAFQDLAERFEAILKAKQHGRKLTGEDFFGFVVHLDELMNLNQVMSGVLQLSGKGAAIVEKNTDLSPAASGEQHYYQSFVHDLAQRQGKRVDCVVEGIDSASPALRSVVREIAVQMVRNAVVHGIETPERRQQLGKLPTGRVRLTLSPSPQGMLLTIEDDGRGLDDEAIRRKAVMLGWYSEAEARALSPKALLDLLFRPQFSTAAKVDGDAGRGVGLDLVKQILRERNGKLSVQTKALCFTRFSFLFPNQE